MLPPAYGTLGFSFNFTIQQYGGAHRQKLPVESYKTEDEDAVTPIRLVNPHANKNPDDSYSYYYNKLPDQTTTRLTQYVARDWNTGMRMAGSFNNGPGDYELNFLPGGEERVVMEFKGGQTKEFVVPYLNVEIRNTKSYKRPEINSDSVLVSYDGVMQHMDIQPLDYSKGVYHDPYGYAPVGADLYWGIFGQNYPDPINLAFNEDGLVDTNSVWIPKSVGMSNLGGSKYKLNTNEYIGKYNLASYAFVNSRNLPIFKFKEYDDHVATVEGSESRKLVPPSSYSGLPQNRYYMSAISTDGQDTLDFANVLNIGGLSYVFNYVNIRNLFWNQKTVNVPRDDSGEITGKIQTKQPTGIFVDGYEYGEDFEAGDVVTLKSTGGAFGMPLPGAKVRVKIGEHTPENQDYSDGMMDDVLVVPNPYYVSHQGEKSPYDSKIYFTKLPERCTINIYTLTGDLVQTIEHDEFTASQPGKAAVEVWNLLTDNNQRVQSQTLIAHISTPNGAETVKPFTIVVGGFRIIND